MNLGRVFRRVLLALVAFVLIYAFGAVAGAILVAPGNNNSTNSKPRIDVLLVAGPIHYDILLPLDDVSREVFAELESIDLPLSHPNAVWLVIGWGAHDFYTDTGNYADLKVKTVLKALFGDRSVIRMDLAGHLPPQLETRKILFSDAQFLTLMRSILSSFNRDDDGQVIPLDHPGFSETDVFYEAVERFDALRTCNVWIATQLRAAGLRFGFWTPTPYSVTLSHWLYHSP